MAKTVKISAEIEVVSLGGYFLPPPPPRVIKSVQDKVQSYISDNNITDVINIQYIDNYTCFLTHK